MGERTVKPRLTCPNCGETVLAEDVFCFHCGRRLKAAQSGPPNAVSRRFRQWPLAVAGVLAFIAAGYVIHHQQQQLTDVTHTSVRGHHLKKTRVVLHPVVSTTTSYPSNLPSSAHWTVEVERYHTVQVSLRLPTSLAHLEKSSSTAWTWGATSTPDRVTLGIVGAKPGNASVSLGPNTWGTPIQNNATTASQNLYVEWTPGHWAEVLMTVPAQDEGWLGSIAESVRIS